MPRRVDPNPALGSGTYATGAVNVGSNGVGGGLVGLNDGLILGALATGRVTGAAGRRLMLEPYWAGWWG